MSGKMQSPTNRSIYRLITGFCVAFLAIGIVMGILIITDTVIIARGFRHEDPVLRVCLDKTSGPGGYLWPIPITGPINPLTETPFNFNKVKTDKHDNWNDDDNQYKLEHEGDYSVRVHLNLQLDVDEGPVAITIWAKQGDKTNPIATKTYSNNGPAVLTMPVDIVRDWDFDNDDNNKVWVSMQSNNTNAFLVMSNYCMANVFEVYSNRP
jgi:hypothetical protein